LRNIIPKIEEKHYFRIYYKGNVESMLPPKLSYSEEVGSSMEYSSLLGPCGSGGEEFGKNAADLKIAHVLLIGLTSSNSPKGNNLNWGCLI